MLGLSKGMDSRFRGNDDGKNVKMKNKIALFLIALLLGALGFQTALLAQAIPSFTESAYINYTQGPNNCYQGDIGQGICCNISGDLYINWSKNYIDPSIGSWISVVIGRTAYTIGSASDYQGSWHVESLSGSYCGKQLENEARIFGVGEYFQWVHNVDAGFEGAQASGLANPIGAPIGSPGSPIYGSTSASILATPDKYALTKDPVNIATGEAYFSSTDFSLSGQGPELRLFRKYRSFSTLSGMFGYGWRTDYDANLSVDSNGDVTIYDGEGTGIYFMNYPGTYGTYMPSPGNYSTLVKNVDGTIT